MATVIGFAGFSNSGKTTLICHLVAYFAQADIQCAVVKHDAHGHYKEAANSDSSLFIEAGSAAAIVISPETFIAYRRVSITLEEVLSKLHTEDYDFIFIEGFKSGNHHKIAIFREEEQAGILSVLAAPPLAIVAPEEFSRFGLEGIPFFELDDVSSIAGWIQSLRDL